MDRWRISYKIVPVKDVVRVEGDASLGLRFAYAGDMWVGIDHDLDVPDGGDALRISLPKIRALLALLEFRWRTETPISLQGATSTRLHREAQ